MDTQVRLELSFPLGPHPSRRKEVQVSGGYYLLIGWRKHLNTVEAQTKEKETFGSTNQRGERKAQLADLGQKEMTP